MAVLTEACDPYTAHSTKKFRERQALMKLGNTKSPEGENCNKINFFNPKAYFLKTQFFFIKEKTLIHYGEV